MRIETTIYHMHMGESSAQDAQNFAAELETRIRELYPDATIFVNVDYSTCECVAGASVDLEDADVDLTGADTNDDGEVEWHELDYLRSCQQEGIANEIDNLRDEVFRYGEWLHGARPRPRPVSPDAGNLPTKRYLQDCDIRPRITKLTDKRILWRDATIIVSRLSDGALSVVGRDTKYALAIVPYPESVRWARIFLRNYGPDSDAVKRQKALCFLTDHETDILD